MSQPDAPKTMNLEELVKHAEAVGQSFNGFISVDGASGVLYSPTFQRCPYLPLPKDWTYHLLNEHQPIPCTTPPFRLRWLATIFPKKAEAGSPEAMLTELVVALANAAQAGNQTDSTAIGNGLVAPTATGVGNGLVAPEMLVAGRILAYFENDTQFRENWTIKDGITRQIVFNNAPINPGQRQGRYLAASAAGYGDAYYMHEGTSFSHKGFIRNNDIIKMY